MIRIQELTPSIYSSHSRDFQLIERLFDVVLNSVKTNADMLYGLPFSDFSDEKLIDLMTLTLGFKSKHRYNVKQLTALCGAFAKVVRLKGTFEAIDIAGNALLGAEGIADEISSEYELNDDGTYDTSKINVYVPQGLSDLNLLKDLLDYILPAGVSCNIIQELKVAAQFSTKAAVSDKVAVYNNDGTERSASNEFEDVLDATTSIVAKAETAYGQQPKATPGVNSNITVVKPE